MRGTEPKVFYLVGTPKGRLTKLEAQLLERPWQQVREGVEVKVLAQAEELYLLAKSRERASKERAMRRRQLKRLWKRLAQLRDMKLRRDRLLLKLGSARQQAPRAWRLVEIEVPAEGSKLTYRLRKETLRAVRRREGHYLLRTNLSQREPTAIWEFYTLLTQIEQAFKNLKGELAIRPIFHQKEPRVEAHILVAFLAYCLHVTLRQKLRRHAPGLTPRAVLEKFATMQMLDAWFPTTDGRWLVFARYTQPEKDHRLLLGSLDLQLPAQRPPRITAQGKLAAT